LKTLTLAAPILLALFVTGEVVFGDDLAYPVDVAVGPDGTLFVADHEAHALLKWSEAAGTWVVVAKGEGRPRTPLYGIRHIVVGANGTVVASDPATMKLYRISASGTIDAVPDDDRFVTPWGVALEPSGDILAVDRVTHRLRRVKDGGAAEDVLEIRAPRAVLFDKAGAVVVLTDKNLVRVNGNETTELASSPPFEFPHDAVLHPNGNYYVTDGYAKAIWRVGADGTVAPLVQGEPMQSPQGIALDEKGNLIVADAHAKAVFRVTTGGEITRIGE
jgi:sugar lactone lactonase YvrE